MFDVVWRFLLFILFDDCAIFSEVDDPQSFDDNDVALSSHLLFDWNFIPLVGVLGAGVPPVLFPVAFRLVGLVYCSFRDSFTGSPDTSSLNMVHLGFLYLKNANRVLFSQRIYIQHNHRVLRDDMDHDMQSHCFLITAVVSVSFEPTVYVMCKLVFSHRLFCIFVQMFLDLSLWWPV